MSGKEKHNPITKYFVSEKFIEYCNANLVDASESALESYEKHDLLYPMYRVVCPDDYVRAIFEYNQKVRVNPQTLFECKPDWKPIEELNNDINWFPLDVYSTLSVLEKALEIGHPLDSAYRQGNPYLLAPNKDNLKPWDEYNIVAGEINGKPIKKCKACHYYAAWQIYVIDELNQMHTIKENFITGYKKVESIFGGKPHSSKLLKWKDIFQTVSNYRMLSDIVFGDELGNSPYGIIEGQNSERLKTKEIEIAKREYSNHSEGEWNQFVRKLCETYENYQEREKVKLSKELKRFLLGAVELILNASGWSYERLCDEVRGGYKGRGRRSIDGMTIYPLESIFPNEENQLRERLSWVLPENLKRLNRKLTPENQLDIKLPETLVDELFSSGYESILMHIYHIEKVWFNRNEIYCEGILWSHLRSLATSIESIGRFWFPKAENLEGVFCEVFGDIKYKNYKGRLGNNTTYASDPQKYREKLSQIIQSNLPVEDLCGDYILISHLTRNYIGHGGKYEPDMLGSRFVKVYESLIFSLLTLYAKKNFHV